MQFILKFGICSKMGNGCFSSSGDKEREDGEYEKPDTTGPVHGNQTVDTEKKGNGDDDNLDERYFRRDISSYPPIIQAILKNNVIGLKYMIEKGVDVNTIDADEETPLMKAAVGGHVECLKILLDAGADVNIEDTYGETALMKAITNDQKDCVDIFITKGVDEISVGKTGDETILIWTAENGHEKYLNYFITLGASVNRPDRHGTTALLKAAANGHLDCL